MLPVAPSVSRRRFLRTAIAGFGAAALGGCITTDPKTSPGAIVFMHGTRSSPSYPPFAQAASRLRSAGFAVATPEMGWSRNRYLSGSLSAAFDQIGAEVESFRKAGYSKVLVGGHSKGGGIAVGYAAARGSIDGLILLAPGFSPAQFTWATGESLSRAREMVAAGRGAERATFVDVDLGRRLAPVMSAADYLTWFDPAGDGEMRNTVRRIPANVPVFVAIGTSDIAPLRALGRQVFDEWPAPYKRFVAADADHERVLYAAGNAMVEWLAEVFPAPGGKPKVA